MASVDTDVAGRMHVKMEAAWGMATTALGAGERLPADAPREPPQHREPLTGAWAAQPAASLMADPALGCRGVFPKTGKRRKTREGIKVSKLVDPQD